MDKLDSPLQQGSTRAKHAGGEVTCSWRRPDPVFSHEYQLLRAALLEARLQAGVPQRGLAARLGKSPSHLARIARSMGVAPAPLFEAVTGKLEAAERERSTA